MIGVLQETEQTADNTAVELTNQREQIGRITEEAIEIDTLLTRADRLVKVFSKRMMTDKVHSPADYFTSGDRKKLFHSIHETSSKADKHIYSRACMT